MIADPYIADGTNIASYDEDEIELLEDYALDADAYTLYTGTAYARNVLQFFYDHQYWQEPEFDPAPPKIYHVNNNKQNNEVRSTILVYPNPTNGYITFQLENNNTNKLEVQLFDMMGRMLFNSQVQGNTLTISTTEWPNGIYGYRVIGNNIFFSGKIVVQ
jgi:hypothetical protein